MTEWKEYRLEDLYTFASGLSKPANEFGFGYPFLTFKDVFNNYFIPKELTELVNSTQRERESCSIKRGDVFLTRTSETAEELGMSSVALMDYHEATFNGFTKRLRPKYNNAIWPEFIGYYLRWQRFRAHIIAMASETTRASLNNSMMATLPVTLPSLQEQKNIAAVLSSLDDKIDLLHRQNATLEAMAEALFRQWFVVEAKEEWEKRSLSSIADFLNGLACQKHPPLNVTERLPVLKIRELNSGIGQDVDWASSAVSPEYIITSGDVIFSWSGSLMVKIWSGENCILNQHLFKVTSGNYPKWFYYFWCKKHLAEFIAISESKATTMGHIKRGDLDKAEVLVPTESELVEMSEGMQPILGKFIFNQTQIRTLEKLRDTLLPKLMSGEVRLRR